MVSRGAELTARSLNGTTSFHSAVYFDSRDCAEALLEVTGDHVVSAVLALEEKERKRECVRSELAI